MADPAIEFTYQVEEGQGQPYVNGLPTTRCDDRVLVKALHTRIYPEVGLLPPVVRWLSTSGRCILLERPPQIQTVHFHADKPYNIADGNVKEHMFELPLPWLLYGIELGVDYYPISINIYALRHPVRGLKDRLGVLPLPNHYASGGLCMPPRDLTEQPSSIAAGIHTAFRLAWHSGFNLDVDNVAHAFRYKRPAQLFAEVRRRPSVLRIYRTWQKADLTEVTDQWEWSPPKGFGAGVNAQAGVSIQTVHQLISQFQMREHERGMANPGVNMIVAIREAMSVLL